VSTDPATPEGSRSPFARWVAYRRRRIQAELSGDRESRVPTWALVVFLVVFVTAWITFVAVLG
jgi:hypothetical protein